MKKILITEKQLSILTEVKNKSSDRDVIYKEYDKILDNKGV